MTLPTTGLFPSPSSASGDGNACGKQCSQQDGDADADPSHSDDNNVLRGVPLRQRQLPASFWEEPNVPRYYGGYPNSIQPPSMTADYPGGFPHPHRAGLPDYAAWTSAYASAGPDYGYGTCTCPHCASEKHHHLRGTQTVPMYAASSMYAEADAMKGRVVDSAGTASWMWSPGCSKAPQVGGLLPSAAPYTSPYAAGAAAGMMSAVVDPTEGYVAAHHHHHNTLWKGASVPATSGTPYLSLPYSFN